MKRELLQEVIAAFRALANLPALLRQRASTAPEETAPRAAECPKNRASLLPNRAGWEDAQDSGYSALGQPGLGTIAPRPGRTRHLRVSARATEETGFSGRYCRQRGRRRSRPIPAVQIARR